MCAEWSDKSGARINQALYDACCMRLHNNSISLCRHSITTSIQANSGLNPNISVCQSVCELVYLCAGLDLLAGAPAMWK